MSITGFPAFDRAAAAGTMLRARLAEQTAQAAEGRRAESYDGLGADARRAIDLRSELAHRAALSRAATQGASLAAHAQVMLRRLTEIATDMAARAGTMIGATSTDVTVTAQSARTALQEVAGLLNERVGGEAVFGGSDTTGTPIPGDVTASGMYRQIGTALRALGGGNGAAVRAQMQALGASDAAGVTPFSAFATAAAQGLVPDPRRGVAVEDGTVVPIGLLANRNAGVPASTAADSTGSWARDLLYGLSALAQLDGAQTRLGADYDQVVTGIAGALKAAVTGVTQESGTLGLAEARIEAARSRHEEISSQIEAQLGAVENVDLAEAITRLQSTQTQLEASYRSLSSLGNLSLSKFLG
jgi:flagellin-like hook-associated protein FlgL